MTQNVGKIRCDFSSAIEKYTQWELNKHNAIHLKYTHDLTWVQTPTYNCQRKQIYHRLIYFSTYRSAQFRARKSKVIIGKDTPSKNVLLLYTIFLTGKSRDTVSYRKSILVTPPITATKPASKKPSVTPS